jgi:NAD(P)-dependent dehydrogenase (short-subunit alcohol dehydrogenase family)
MDLLEETAHMAAPSGVKVVTGRCDVTDEAQVKAFVHTGLAECGRIDVVVNNAGWRARGALLRISTEHWLATMDVNLHAPFLMSQAVLPSMVQHRRGRIINGSGIAAFRGATGTTAQLAAAGLTRAMAREYGQYNMTANCIGAGGIETEEADEGLSFPPGPRDPIARWGKPEEMAFLAVSLASEEVGYVTGQCVLANGGKYFL